MCVANRYLAMADITAGTFTQSLVRNGRLFRLRYSGFWRHVTVSLVIPLMWLIFISATRYHVMKHWRKNISSVVSTSFINLRPWTSKLLNELSINLISCGEGLNQSNRIWMVSNLSNKTSTFKWGSKTCRILLVLSKTDCHIYQPYTNMDSTEIYAFYLKRLPIRGVVNKNKENIFWLNALWYVFARSNTGIMGSNSTQGMDVCVR
jgi:hypothetical protein